MILSLRYNLSFQIIILIFIKYSSNLNFLLNNMQLEAYFRYSSPHLINYFGITQDPKTKNYAIVMEYAENGDLQSYLKYLKKNKISLFWHRKLDIL